MGSAVSKIYFTPSGTRELYTLVYWLDGKRKREVFPSMEKAVAAAKSANTELGKGDLGAADLSAKDRVGCARALDIIAPFGVPIELVASEYAYFKLKLGDDVPLGRVVDDYARRHPADQVSKMVRDVADELIESKRVGGAAARGWRPERRARRGRCQADVVHLQAVRAADGDATALQHDPNRPEDVLKVGADEDGIVAMMRRMRCGIWWRRRQERSCRGN